MAVCGGDGDVIDMCHGEGQGPSHSHHELLYVLNLLDQFVGLFLP
jgi:hypothetical protein